MENPAHATEARAGSFVFDLTAVFFSEKVVHD